MHEPELHGIGHSHEYNGNGGSCRFQGYGGLRSRSDQHIGIESNEVDD